MDNIVNTNQQRSNALADPNTQPQGLNYLIAETAITSQTGICVVD